MSYYTERHGMRKPVERTYCIDSEKYGIIMRCCERYFDNIAWKYPLECEDGRGYYGLNMGLLAEDIKYEIPTLFLDDFGIIGVPKVHYNVFGENPKTDEYDQYALLDFIEFMNENIRDIEKSGYHKFYDHYHLNTKSTANIRANFKNDINVCFKRLGLLYNLSEKGEVERVIVNDVATSEIDRQVLNVKEKGTKELLQEAIYLHRSHDPKAARDSVEKLWDAFERLKTYYTGLDKKHSAQKIVDDIAAGKSEYVTFFTEEFNALTKIGNTYRIRHHETNKIEITDFRYYDYFFNRCLSLIAIAIQYLN